MPMQVMVTRDECWRPDRDDPARHYGHRFRLQIGYGPAWHIIKHDWQVAAFSQMY
jgi:hypothetical protein